MTRISNVAKLWNAIMKQKFRLCVIHQTVTSLQRTNNLNSWTRRYPTLDESNWMKSTYFTIHPGKNPPPPNGCRLKSVVFSKHMFPILHFPNSTGLFTKPTGHRYTKYRFSPDIELMYLALLWAPLTPWPFQTVWWALEFSFGSNRGE